MKKEVIHTEKHMKKIQSHKQDQDKPKKHHRQRLSRVRQQYNIEIRRPQAPVRTWGCLFFDCFGSASVAVSPPSMRPKLTLPQQKKIKYKTPIDPMKKNSHIQQQYTRKESKKELEKDNYHLQRIRLKENIQCDFPKQPWKLDFNKNLKNNPEEQTKQVSLKVNQQQRKTLINTESIRNIQPKKIMLSVAPKSTFTQSYKLVSEIRGLRNIGNSCYINCILQCLHKSLLFQDQVFKFDRQCKNRKSSPDLLIQTKRLFVQLNKYSRDACQTYQIKQIVAKSNILFGSFNQNDASQFLNSFISVLAQETNNPNGKEPRKIDHMSPYIKLIYLYSVEKDQARMRSMIDEIMTGRYQVTFNCKECNGNYTKFQKFNIHYIQIPTQKGNSSYFRGYSSYNKKYSVFDCMKKFQEEQILDGENAMMCNSQICQGKDTRTAKTMKIYTTNKMFVICFKRFDNGYKNSSQIELQPYLTINDKKYRLYGIVLHFGSLYGGHYTSVCYNQRVGSWLEYNDSRVMTASLETVNKRDVYALFYEQIRSEAIKNYQTEIGSEILDDEISAKSIRSLHQTH